MKRKQIIVTESLTLYGEIENYNGDESQGTTIYDGDKVMDFYDIVELHRLNKKNVIINISVVELK